MDETLKTHLIERDGMGIDEDDYDAFLAKRGAKLWAMIDARINPFATPVAVAPAADLVEG